MDVDKLRALLDDVRAGRLDVEGALERLRTFPYDDLGDYARLDVHRPLRQGLPEVVFCEGKTTEQAVAILERLWRHHDRVLGTRVSPEMAVAIRARLPEAHYDPVSRLLTLTRTAAPPPPDGAPCALVLSAGTSDLPVAEEAAQTLEFLGDRVVRLYDVGVAGLHRLLGEMERLRRADVIITVAGMDGALTSVVAGLVACPVVGVPTGIGYGANLSGVAPLLTMLNSCASGVAVVNIGNGFGAGVYAHLILQRIRRAAEGVGEGVVGDEPSPPARTDALVMLETNIDDMNPELYEHVMARLFDAGALDVFLSPVQMKKNRPATVLHVLCRPEHAEALRGIIFAETSTLGIRQQSVERYALHRATRQVDTPYGPVRVKVAYWGAGRMKCAPEYEDCRRLAEQSGVPLREIYRAAESACGPSTNETRIHESRGASFVHS